MSNVTLITHKICSKCGVSKDVRLFNKDRTMSCGIRSYCKSCEYQLGVNNDRTILGLIKKIFRSQKKSSIERNHPPPTYNISEFTEWVISHPSFKRLYVNWVLSDYNKKLRPSVDRLNDYKGYSLDNIQLITWEENHIKASRDRINGVNNKVSKAIVAYKDGLFIKRYHSVSDACRKTGFNRPNIINVLMGRYRQLHGCVFFYEDDIGSDFFLDRFRYIPKGG